MERLLPKPVAKYELRRDTTPISARHGVFAAKLPSVPGVVFFLNPAQA